MRIAALAVGLALLAIVPVAGARLDVTTAPPFPVAILQGKPLPVQATVLLNGKVTWRNLDRVNRRVKSDTNAWPAFTLRPRRTKTVTFRRRGCFRYKVDGRAAGRVAVATSCGGGGGGGGGGATNTVIYRYDVALEGHAKETEVVAGETAPDLNGTMSIALDWTGTFDNVAVKKLTVGNQWIVGMNTGLFATGTMTGTHAFSDSRGRFGGPCQGQVAIPTSGAHFFLGGQRSPATPLSEFHLAAQMDLEPGTAMANRIYAAQEAACKGSTKGLPHDPIEKKDVQGLEVSSFVGLLQMDADRRDEAGRLWFPLTQLQNGQGFTIDTGLVTATNHDCGSTCTNTKEGRLKITLTPHR